jgi:hypothetical protein
MLQPLDKGSHFYRFRSGASNSEEFLHRMAVYPKSKLLEGTEA